jgi:hypothetical protein
MDYPQTQNQDAYCVNNPLKYIDPQGMDCVFVILPDGTISYEMAEIYNKMQNALGNLSEDDWQFINEKLSSSDPAVKMEAVKMILDAAGIDYEDWGSVLTITINEKEFHITWGDTGDDYGWTIPLYSPDMELKGGTIMLNPDKITQGGDLFLTLGHELVHAYLTAFHWDRIVSLEALSICRAYGEYAAYSWSLSVVHSVPFVTPSHANDIITVYWKYRMKWTIRGELMC